MATVMPRLEGVRLVVYSFHVDTAVAHTLPLATGCFWPLATNALASHLVLPHVEDLP